MVAWTGTLLILSSIIQEILRPKSFEESSKGEAVSKIMQLMPIFHLLWVVMLIGSAFVGVN